MNRPTLILATSIAFILANLTTVNAAVSKNAFKEALNQLEVYQDEFVGNYEIFGYPNSDYWSYDAYDNYYDVSLNLVKKDEKSKWRVVMMTFYSGEDWIFHNELNLKSSKGKLNLKIPSASRDVDDGRVSESGALFLTNSQRLNYCKIISGDDVTFRLRGNKGSVEGLLLDGSIAYSLALCTVYQGLLQGYKLDL
jgi:hypothetical protein